MNKPLATLGIFAVTGALSLCDLCGPRAAGTNPGLTAPLSVAYAAAAQVQQPQARPPASALPKSPAGAAKAQPTAAVQTVTFAVTGMTCAGCVLGTRTVLKRLPGVATADVSYEKGTAVVTYDPAKVTVAQMVAAIKTLGYIATKVAGG